MRDAALHHLLPQAGRGSRGLHHIGSTAPKGPRHRRGYHRQSMRRVTRPKHGSHQRSVWDRRGLRHRVWGWATRAFQGFPADQTGSRRIRQAHRWQSADRARGALCRHRRRPKSGPEQRKKAHASKIPQGLSGLFSPSQAQGHADFFLSSARKASPIAPRKMQISATLNA